MKAFVFSLIIVFGAVTLKAQDTYFATKDGMVLTYKTFDKKDKLASWVRYTIKDVKTNGNKMDITYQTESFDKKDKLVYKEDILIHQEGDLLYLDMSNFVNKGAFQQNGEIPAEVEIKGNNMQIPVKPQPGASLPDANLEMAMKMGIINMKFSVDVTNRKVAGFENATVTAGSFQCCKITSNIYSVALGIKINATTIDWYAKGVGTVKSETYDKKGELMSRTELTEIK